MSGLDGLGWPTDDMIDWSTAPKWAIGAAMDKDESWFWYGYLPFKDALIWCGHALHTNITPNPPPAPNWRESWTPRLVTTNDN